MHIEPLKILHQELLQPRLQQLNSPLSEYSFANLYLFRERHQYEVITIDDHVFLKGVTRDHIPYIMPTSHPANIPRPILKQVLSTSYPLFPIPDEWLLDLDHQIFHSDFNENESDYLYSRTKFLHYAGRHLDSKRNQIKQLLKQNEVKSVPFSDQIKDAELILEIWAQEYGEENQTDYLSCLEAVRNAKELNLHGRIVYVNKKPAVFFLGEWGAKNSFMVHFSKGDKSIKGIYPYLFQDLAKSLGEGCSWINLEQDLGLPSLRYSKKSYQPDFLLKKWRLHFIVDE